VKSNNFFNEEQSNIIKELPINIAIFDNEMKYLSYTNKFLEDYNFDKNINIIGKSHYEVFPEISESWIIIHQKGLAGETISKDNEKFVRLDGSIQYISWEIKPWYKKNNTVGGIVLTTIDTTNKIKSEELKQEVEKKNKKQETSLDLLDKAFIVTDDGIWDWNVAENRVYFSPGWKSMLGYTNDEIKNDFYGWEKLLHPDDLEYAKAEAVSLANGEISNIAIEFRMRCKNGTYKWIFSRSKVVEVDKNNNPIRLVGTHTDIQSKKEFQTLLENQKIKYQNLLKLSSEGIFIMSSETGKLLEYSEIVKELLGYSKKELDDLSVLDWDKDINCIEEYKEIISAISYEPINFERTHIRKNGTRYIASINAVKINVDGEELLYSSVRDISNTKENQRKLEEQNQKLTTLKTTLDNAIEIATLGIWEWDAINDILTWSDIVYDIYGLDKNTQLSVKLIETIIYKDDLELHRQQINNYLSKKESIYFEYRIVKDDEIRTISAIGKPIIENDKLIRMTGVVQDITDFKRKEKELLDAQKIAKLGSYNFDIANNSFTTSHIVHDIFGVPQDYKKTFDTWVDLIHEDDKEMMQNYFMHIIKEKEDFDKEYRIREFKNNTIKWVHGLGVIKFDKNDNPYRLFGTIQDITQRKVIETQMKQALTVFENTHDSIMITNSNNEIINVNKSFINTTGYSLEEVIGEKPSILKSFIYQNEFYKQMWESIENNEFWQGEITNKRKNGELFESYLAINSLKDNNGNIYGYIGIFSDISIMKYQEKMIIQQSRTSAIGEMIGNIAHQWRQPLSVISTAATGMKLQLEIDSLSKEETITSLSKINDYVQYLSETIEDFSGFFKEDLSIKKFKINEVFEKVENLTRDAFKINFIEVFQDIDKNTYIVGNKNLLIQALINIYNNALDVLKKKNIKEKRLLFIKVKKENAKINIHIKDNAGGIPLAYTEKIFDPYFTTKHQSQGTGIGLYMTHQIVIKQLKGTIKASNVTYKYEDKNYSGAEFIISI
jgi:PAS domain S-box-containing protein